MNCTEYSEQVRQTCRVVKTLSRKNGACILQLRHRSLGRDLVLRQYAQPVFAYECLKALHHPNLPEVYDSLCFADGQIVLEEYIEGLTVAEVLQIGCYTVRGAAALLRQVCAAVMALHSCGILHRDIKPENVIVTSAGQVKLIDLNASQPLALGQEGGALGTIGYAAYEQLGLSRCDERTDVFALGVLLNVMLTGEHPSRKLAKGRAGRLVLKCTQIDPDSRYQSRSTSSHKKIIHVLPGFVLCWQHRTEPGFNFYRPRRRWVTAPAVCATVRLKTGSLRGCPLQVILNE